MDDCLAANFALTADNDLNRSGETSEMSRRRDRKGGRDRPPRLDNAPLDYAPANELGVVYLFSHLARKRFGLRVERVQASFPDCLAFRDGRRVRIEFEYRSRNFVQHRHDPRSCDWIVCWVHDWPAVPRRIRVVELRKEFNLGFNVWFQPSRGDYSRAISRSFYSWRWSVPSQASEGDLILIYMAAPDMCVKHIFRVASPVGHVRAEWKPGKDFMSSIRLVCRLKAPLHFRELQQHPILKHAGFVRGLMRGRYRASEYWPELYQMILARNPSLKAKLSKYGPDRLA